MAEHHKYNEQSEDARNAESLRRLAEALGQNPAAFNKQVEGTGAGKRAENAYAQRNSQESISQNLWNHNNQESRLQEFESKNRPETVATLKTCIHDLQQELGNPHASPQSVMRAVGANSSVVPFDFPVQIPNNCNISSLRRFA